ncbi:3-oxoacyl- acyl-carrier-protein reductase, partial [Musa troglodytarum]
RSPQIPLRRDQRLLQHCPSRKSPAIEAAVHDAWNAFGRIDALVNNAGVRGGVYSAVDWSEEEWHRIMTTNLTGLWLVSKHVCIRMRDAKQKGAVINISSIAGAARGQVPGSLAYSASKAGVNSITSVMALEMGR